MKRVAELGGLDDVQQEAIRRLLRDHGFSAHETPPTLFSSAALWVPDEDYAAARAVLDPAEAELAAQAHDAFEREYAERWKGSYWRWLVGRIIEEPVRLAMIVALGVVVWFGVIYWFVR
jgi:hypothetical protein